jgi:hypothetical protein
MQPRQDTYPIFEPNQVLTNRHLNQVFDYLDEQERLTRANLIGIGIVCGLEIEIKQTISEVSILLSKGCGVTSQGYLIVEPEEQVKLLEYKTYTLPDEVDEYTPFKYDATDQGNANKNIRKQYDLWELFEAGEPNSTKLTAAPANFLKDKAVLLFLELKKSGLRNCSPNNCDDKGAEVAATVRRLLIGKNDLANIIAATYGKGPGLTPVELDSLVLKRLELPDIRLPRYNVPNTGLATSEDVYAGFLDIFRDNSLAKETGMALSNAYKAFEPILQVDYPADPFANSFGGKFGFLDSVPVSADQVRFLQYYYDLFDDLLKAYDEFRWKGVDLMCACCPRGSLFPRHLMLGLLEPATDTKSGIYRHPFLASPAISSCDEHTLELRILFHRLVEMVRSFTNVPIVPSGNNNNQDVTDIRITPSKLADVPLSDKAIPYYYKQDGTVPLYQRWNATKTRRHRANQNLGYWSQDLPNVESFVNAPLNYDLEPYNFLRIEGHIGQNYQVVLETLLQMKETNRLPVEIIALRTGVLDENISVDLSQEACQFQDLELLYQVKREEWFGFLSKKAVFFYDISLRGAAPNSGKKVVSQFELINNYAPGFSVSAGTIGLFFEELITKEGGAIPDYPPGFIIDFINKANPDYEFIVYTFFYIFKIYDILKNDLKNLDYEELAIQIEGLQKVAAAQESRLEVLIPSLKDPVDILKWEEIDDHLEDVVSTCFPGQFKVILDEYALRVLELKQKQFFSFFLQKHPGIQHKSGVTLGGTFILVYHQEDEPLSIKNLVDVSKLTVEPFSGTGSVLGSSWNLLSASKQKLATVTKKIQGLKALSELDKSIIVEALRKPLDPKVDLEEFANNIRAASIEKIIADTVEGLPNGAVIADFFLPYLCCSDCAPVSFSLPALPPSFTFEVGCTDKSKEAKVTIKPRSGVPPYSIKINSGGFVPLSDSGQLSLPKGDHIAIIQDARAIQSSPKSISIPDPLSMGDESYDCNDSKQYIIKFDVSGGRPPYTSSVGSFVGTTFTSNRIKSGEDVEIIISDSVGCQVSRRFNYICPEPCVLPCDGEAIRCQFRFWAPVGSPGRLLEDFKFDIGILNFEGPNSENISLRSEVQNIIKLFDKGSFNNNFEKAVKDTWITPLNKLIADKTGSDNWLKFGYLHDADEKFGTLSIERFKCLKLIFSFTVIYKINGVQENILINYSSNSGLEITPTGAAKVTIPPLACETRNKCKSGSQWKPIFTQKPFDLEINALPPPAAPLTNLPTELNLTFSAKTSRANAAPKIFVWEADGANPPLANGETVTFKIPRTATSLRIRLWAFTEDGNYTSVVKIINKP